MGNVAGGGSAGRLHSGEAGISGIRKEIQRLINEEMGLDFTKGVQVTVIREAGPFDEGPFIFEAPQFFSRYPVLKIHHTTIMQAARNVSVMPKLSATLTSAIS